jgi:hypothetical protein
MTNLESDEDRLSRAMRRLMQVDPPRLAPVRPRAQHWLGAVVVSLATLVVVAGVVGGSAARQAEPAGHKEARRTLHRRSDPAGSSLASRFDRSADLDVTLDVLVVVLGPHRVREALRGEVRV